MEPCRELHAGHGLTLKKKDPSIHQCRWTHQSIGKMPGTWRNEEIPLLPFRSDSDTWDLSAHRLNLVHVRLVSGNPAGTSFFLRVHEPVSES